MPPVTPFTCQETLLLGRFVAVAVRVSVLPRRTWLEPVTVIDGVLWVCVVVGEPPPHPARAASIKGARAEQAQGSRRDRTEDLLTLRNWFHKQGWDQGMRNTNSAREEKSRNDATFLSGPTSRPEK